jgi:uncharacterized membrane protein YdjX (TVP38/TMEM64 family)
MNKASENIDKPAANTGLRKKMIALGVIIAVVAVLYLQFRHYLRLEYLADREAELKSLRDHSPLLVVGAAFLIYVTVTGLSLPGAALLSLGIGWFFGFRDGMILVSFASTSGATVAFLISRYFFRDTIQLRFGDRIRTFNESLEREGAFYLFTLRLIPVVPFFVINAVMGLTKIRVWTFWWVSQLGMLPGTAVYIYAGSSVPDLKKLSDEGLKTVFTPSQLTQIAVAFVLLGVFPLATKWVTKRIRPTTTQPIDPPADQEDSVA